MGPSMGPAGYYQDYEAGRGIKGFFISLCFPFTCIDQRKVFLPLEIASPYHEHTKKLCSQALLLRKTKVAS
ncbi:hypothetical protein OPV22_018766 [Ensete ventricosum]|uniref:Uncharacterized protein n=1 Tax=Ensete ventricosum TaxID=4639 RepID=A0AAV8PG71_ENSVE|nr:hypothetical protein OPV22_018766 [Ensete ventricosum]